MAHIILGDPYLNSMVRDHKMISSYHTSPAGEHFSDCKIIAASKLALDEEAAETLWKRSEEWTKL